MKIELQSYEEAVTGDYIFIVQQKTWLDQLLGREGVQKHYIGRYSFWREFPSFKQCSEKLQVMLHQIHEKMDYEKAVKDFKEHGKSDEQVPF